MGTAGGAALVTYFYISTDSDIIQLKFTLMERLSKNSDH
jgi:hypothetical protein